MKILIITNNAFSKTSNNGKTYEAIFSHFDKHNLAQIFFRPQTNTDLDYCESTYMVSEIDIINKLLFRSKSCGQEISSQQQADINNQSQIYGQKRGSIKRNPIIRDLLWKTGLWKNRILKEWCTRVNPDLIFFIGANQSFTYDIADYIASYLKIPMVLYYTDDYLINPIYTTWTQKIQQWRIKSFYKNAVNQAKIRFCIGEEMAKAYSNYFGKPFFHIMNSVEIMPYSAPVINDSKIRIGYFGGLHLDRWKMIDRLSSLLPDNAEVHVYTFTPIDSEIKSVFDKANVFYHNGIQGVELNEAMNNCDILLHVESDDNYYRSLTRLSVSTKIPEYLIHGRMIIGYGPSEVASLKLLSSNNLGLVLDSGEVDDIIKSELYKYLGDTQHIIKQGQRGYDYAVTHFNKNLIAEEFKNKLMSIINNNK